MNRLFFVITFCDSLFVITKLIFFLKICNILYKIFLTKKIIDVNPTLSATKRRVGRDTQGINIEDVAQYHTTVKRLRRIGREESFCPHDYALSRSIVGLTQPYVSDAVPSLNTKL